MDKREKIIKLAEFIGTEKNVVDHFGYLLKSLEGELDQNSFKIINNFFSSKFMPTLIEDIYNTLDEIIDEDTLDRLLQFYESDFGKLFLELNNKLSLKVQELNNTKWREMLQRGIFSLGLPDFQIDS
jgi:hypothetical protein